MSAFFPSYRTKIEFSDDEERIKNGLNGEEENDGSIIKISESKCELKLASGQGAAKLGEGVGEKKKKKMKKKKGSQVTSGPASPEDEDGDLSPPPVFPRPTYKESTSLDSGIESDHFREVDMAFVAFLQRSDDPFLEPSTRYMCPKFNLNRVDNVLAFTLHAKNVSSSSIACEMLPEINAARVKFASATPKVQNYAFFVKIPQSPGNGSSNNNNTALICDVMAESWDNNVVFQIDLDPRCDDNLVEYQAGLDALQLVTHPMETKIESIAEQHDEDDDEGLSIEVENASENEIKIAIKAKEPLKPQQQQASDGANKRRSKKKARAYSESCCDELKVISESECLKLSSNAVNSNKPSGEGVNVRKTRSISESCQGEIEMRPIPKYKSILKHSYDHSISMDSSVDDIFSVSFGEYGLHSGTDHELSESCKKSVRFSDHITRTLYKSNSSILGQRKKNQRKNDAKKRLLQRKSSEGESDGGDCKENNHTEEEEVFEEGPRGQQGKRGSKGNMIFDLEIDDD